MNHARRKGWLAVPVVISCLLLGTPAIAAKPRAATHPAANKAVKFERHVVASGETLTGILAERGLQPSEILRWDEAMHAAAGEFLLSPGHVLRLEFRGPTLMGLSYEVDDCVRVTVTRRGKHLLGKTEPLQARVRMVAREGVVTKSFSAAARQAGIPEAILSKMADVLGWEFDFRRVRPGDRFRVLYEERTSVDGRPLSPGKLLAAEIRSGKHVVQAFFYNDGGEGVYVDGKGRTIANGFLRFPVEFTRISSHFSRQRFHPVLHVARAHHGVDFAAPIGTPVRAAGDGVVVSAGWQGDYGNQVEIRHENGWSTTYAHLKGFAPGIKAGRAVRQGEVIGWVGQTGLSTGPHLHFALFRNGQYQNPLTAKVELRREVKDRARFAEAKRTLLRQISALVRPAPPVASTMVAALPTSLRPAMVSLQP
ncbi:MAG: peptidoglycan DD-metalloendopeptidase family protein [Candidatus Binatia bacterium]|nr:peptidoglycan DD-metalloendopeptidase family protein [Candidatus Binatia bacterium]